MKDVNQSKKYCQWQRSLLMSLMISFIFIIYSYFTRFVGGASPTSVKCFQIYLSPNVTDLHIRDFPELFTVKILQRFML